MPSGSTTKSGGRRKWFRVHAELVKRIPLMEREAYDHARAYDHLQSIKSAKPLLRCKLYCLTDGIKVKKASRFGQHPPRKFYSYKDIHRFYSFADSPDILTLGCADPDKDTKQYEFFRMEESQVQELCQFIERAHGDPMYRLVDYESGRYQSSQSSLTGDTDTIQDDAEFKKSSATANDLSTEDTVQEEEVQLNSVNPVLSEPEEETIQPELSGTVQSAFVKPNSLLNFVPEHIRDDPLFHSLCANIDEKEIMAVDMQYIEPDGRSGNQIANSGAIYLFVAHHKHPDHVHQCNGDEDCHLCHEENTAETSFTTTFVQPKAES